MRSFSFAVYGTLFTFAMTVLGAATVFFFRKRISPRVSRICFGFAGGVMSAAAVFSLLLPAVEQLEAAGGAAWQTAALGFLLVAAGLLMLVPGTVSDLTGLAVFVGIIVMQKMSAKKAAA